MGQVFGLFQRVIRDLKYPKKGISNYRLNKKRILHKNAHTLYIFVNYFITGIVACATTLLLYQYKVKTSVTPKLHKLPILIEMNYIYIKNKAKNKEKSYNNIFNFLNHEFCSWFGFSSYFSSCVCKLKVRSW